MNTKFIIYIAIVILLLIAWYYQESIEDSISHKVKDAKVASPYVDDRIEGQVIHAMGE